MLFLADDPATSDFVLLMHDLAPAVQGDQLNGCTLGQAELAVETIAGLHASTWAMTDTLAELAWLPQPTEELLEYRSAMYEQFLTGFEAFYGDVLSADDLAIGRWLAPRIVALAQAHRLPRCVVHNDYRLDNLLFAFPG